MKKPKMKLDSAKIKAFFLNHIEKILLVGVVGLMLLLVWQGLTQGGVPTSQTPGKLVTNSASMRTYIDDPKRWEEVGPVRIAAVPKNIGDQVTENQKKVVSQQYFLPNPIKRSDFPKLSPRTDPKLFSPLRLVVHPVIGPLAAVWKNPAEPDPLTVAAIDEAKRRAAPPKIVPKKKKAVATDDASGDMVPTKKPKTKGKTQLGSGSEITLDTAGSTPGMDTAGSGAEMLSADSSYGWTPTLPDQTIARDTRAMVVTAVVPYEKQYDEFQNTLAQSLDYDPQRDTPQYLTFGIQRADVTADPYGDVAGVKWESLSVPKAHIEQLGDPNRNIIGDWAGAPNEVLDPTYLDKVIENGKLTYPAPPFLQRDIWNLLTHPDIPLATQSMYGEGMGQPVPGGAVPGASVDDSPLGIPTVGAGGLGAGGQETLSAPAFRPSSGMQGSSGMPSGMGGSRGGSAPPAGSGMRAPAMTTDANGQVLMAPPKYKLIRFTDTTVLPNHKYRYRLKVYLNDPNHPQLPNPQLQIVGHLPPSLASLHESVQKRIKQVDADDGKKPKSANAVPYRTYWVESEWSEASDIVELPQMGQFLANSVTPPPMARISPTVALPNDQPKASVVAVKWDPVKVADIPAELDKVYRGTLFNFEHAVTKVIHPVTRQVIELAKEKFSTGALVADMQGGDKITALDKQADHALVTPGELLIFDAAGNLHVQNEALDGEEVRRVIMKKPEAPPPVPGSEGTDPAGGSRPTRPTRPVRPTCF